MRVYPVATVLTLTVAWVAPAAALQEPAPPRAELERRVEERFRERIRRALELSPEQFEQIERILDETREARRRLAAEERRARFETDEFMRSGGTAEDARELLDRLVALREHELELWRGEQERLAAVLSPEQRLRFVKLREQFAERVREMRQRLERQRLGVPRGRPPAGRAPAGRPPAFPR